MTSVSTLYRGNGRFPGLRVAIVDNGTPLAPVLRTALSMVEVTGVRVFSTNERALAALDEGLELDMLCLNWCGTQNDPLELAAAIRRSREYPGAFLALMVLLSNVTRERVLAARDAGVDEFLAVPFKPSALAGRINSIVDDRRGFVDTPTYFGPDRRRGAMANYLRCSRSGESELIDPIDGRRYVSREDGTRYYLDDRRTAVAFL